MAALDLLGRRWALRVLWELRDGERCRSATCASAATRCRRASLNQRLHELRDAELVEAGEGGYRLTRRGEQLHEALEPLDGWAKRWAGDATT